MSTDRTLECTGYIEVEPRWWSHLTPDQDAPTGIAVVKATKTRPRVTNEGSVVVKVRFRLPAAAFMPVEPTAVIDVPVELIQHEVAVTAEAPG